MGYTMSTFTCLNGLTISLDKCDCTIDCPSGSDEQYICECESCILSFSELGTMGIMHVLATPRITLEGNYPFAGVGSVTLSFHPQGRNV